MSNEAISQHFRALAAEIWDEVDDLDEKPTAGEAVAEVMHILRGALDDMSSTAKGLGDGQRAVAEGLAQVMAEVVTIIRQGQSEMVGAVQAGALSERVTEAIDGLKAHVAAEAEKTRKTMSGVSMSVEMMGRRLEQMTAALTAPRHLVMDEDGRPVGVRIAT